MTSLLYAWYERAEEGIRLYHPVIGFLFKEKVSQDDYVGLKAQYEQKTRAYPGGHKPAVGYHDTVCKN